MKRIPVTTASRSYDILIDSGILNNAGTLLRAQLSLRNERVFIATSQNVWQLWGRSLTASLEQAGVVPTLLIMPDGEQAKRLTTVEQALESLAESGADRSSVLLAFGGGVIGDMAGFIAALYMRGIRVVQVPTTLQAQVDASIGGKTGVNLSAGKNLAGSFHQPECVLIDPDVLRTLPERELRAGMFEVIKSGIIADVGLFNHCVEKRADILAGDDRAVECCIAASAAVKARVVSQDERESGLRRILNYGHTIGHALEAATHYSHFLHGEAVGWGMIAAAYIAQEMQVSSPETTTTITETVLAYGALPPVSTDAEEVAHRTRSDKKTVAGRTHFVLAPRIGATTIVSDVPHSIVVDAVNHVRALSLSA
ncbi:MAG TPA: 3-dehydroquinate synthase [Terriglobales bacterium]